MLAYLRPFATTIAPTFSTDVNWDGAIDVERAKEEENSSEDRNFDDAQPAFFGRETSRQDQRDSDSVDLTLLNIDDSLSLYLKEIGQVSLLTAEEEVSLAKRMKTGRESRDELTAGLDDSKRRSALLLSIRDGQEAQEHLIKANSRLVVSIAKKYARRGVPLEDLIQEGNIGLMRAVKKFDYRLGYKFSTYATWWIRQAVTRAIANQGRTIRLPVHMHEQIGRLARARHQYNQESGCDPTTVELAAALDVSTAQVEKVIRADRRLMSLDQPVGKDEDSTLSDFVEDTLLQDLGEIAEQSMVGEAIESVLQTLPPREASIVKLRFGLQDGHYYTLEEIGEKYGVTRERIRQIEAVALRRLRHPSRSRHLRDYALN